MNDPKSIHKRFLDYRDKHVYFGRGGMKLVDMATFTKLDAEYYELEAKGTTRDDEQEARFAEVAHLLYRD